MTISHAKGVTAAGFARSVNVQRPSAVLLQRGLYLRRPVPMEPGEVPDETPRQVADLARGDRHAVLVKQCRLDLVPLPVTQEPLQPHENHHIVADDAAGHQRLAQACRSPCDPDSRGPAAPGGAHMDGLTRLEGAMDQGAAKLRRRLLHHHWAVADRAKARGLANGYPPRPQRAYPPLIPLPSLGNPDPQPCQRRELERAVFFPGTR